MEQLCQIAKALGSLKALMVFREDIQINHRQCSLLHDIFSSAYESIAQEMRHNLKFEERNTKWRVLEQPLKELHRIYKEAELYVRQCLETKDWWAKAITLYQNSDCVDFHIHNLLCCIPIVMEAIELAAEFSGDDLENMQKKRFMYSMKYQKELIEPKLFQWKYGKQYLVSEELCRQIDAVGKEDRWTLLNKIQEMRSLSRSKHELRLIDLLNRSLEGSVNGRLSPATTLINSKDYQVRRRLGNGSQYKEVIWLGESFVVRHFFGDIELLTPKISELLSLSHPNISHFLCGFTDEEKKECFLITELMSKNLCSYIKELCGPRKRIPFTLPVTVDLMLQIARGMEYLHEKKIYHGKLNPKNILIKATSKEGCLHAKVLGFGVLSIKNSPRKKSSDQHETQAFIWHAPEVLEEQEQAGSKEKLKYSEKADVYSFGMICFELLTGKVPFEDTHLQGDKMSLNIRAGERPLFPSNSPKYIANLTKKCWHADPNQRPSFSSICKILRYMKRFLVMNPDTSQLDLPMPQADYAEIETGLLKRFPWWGSHVSASVSQIPFQMFVYRVMEKERTGASFKESSESGSEATSLSGDECAATVDDPFPFLTENKPLVSPETVTKRMSAQKSSSDVKASVSAGTPRSRSQRPPQLSPRGRSISRRSSRSETQLAYTSPRMRRTSSDSELS